MLGFMFTTMFLSMWISNTATTAMMLPIVDAVAEVVSGPLFFFIFFPHHIVHFHVFTTPASSLFNTQAINDEHAEKQQMAPLAEGEEEGEGVSHFLCWLTMIMVMATYNAQRSSRPHHKVWSSQVASAVKESKSQESCHLSEEEDVFDAEGVQVTNKGNSRDFFCDFW